MKPCEAQRQPIRFCLQCNKGGECSLGQDLLVTDIDTLYTRVARARARAKPLAAVARWERHLLARVAFAQANPLPLSVGAMATPGARRQRHQQK